MFFVHLFALLLVASTMFPYENDVSLPFINECSLKRFISCNSDKCVETVRIIGNTCSLRQNHVLNEFLRSI